LFPDNLLGVGHVIPVSLSKTQTLMTTKFIIPVYPYTGALTLAFDFLLSKAKNAGLAALGQGFLTHEKGKSINGYASLCRCTNIIFLIVALMIFSKEAPAQARKLKKIQQYIDEATADNLPGLAVYINSPKYGKWIGVSGYSDLENKTPLAQDDIFSLASIGKMYNAVAVLKMVEEGRLTLDDKIAQYLPEEIIENLPYANEVTIKHLLGHTSGFRNYEADRALNRLYISGQLQLDTLSHINALRRYVYGKDSRNKPGMEYHYSSTNYMLLAMIMDAIVPEGHAVYLREQILLKHGYVFTTYKQTPRAKLVKHYGDLDKDGIVEDITSKTVETTNWFIGDDGVYAPIDEAAGFLEALMKGEILDEKTLKKMKTWNDEKDPDYGLGIEADKAFPYKFLMGHSGSGIGNRLDLYYFPKQDLTIGIFCNTGLRAAAPSFAKTYYKMRLKLIKKLFLF
jgi:D-alanyl-D-alanine carboxypeptidase